MTEPDRSSPVRDLDYYAEWPSFCAMSISSPSPTSDTSPSSEEAPGEPPLAVRRSFQLWVAALVIGVLSGLITLIVAPLFRTQIAERAIAAGVDPRTAGTLVLVTAVVVGLIEIALAGLGFVFALKMRSGRNWARIVLVVLAIIGVGDVIAAATSHNHPAMTFTGVLHVLLMVAATVFAYQPSAAGWFGRRSEV